MNFKIRFYLATFVLGVFIILIANYSTLNYNENSPLDNIGAAEYDHLRMADPNTGVIPKNIRFKELQFAETLPVNSSRNFTWELIGPKYLGGRTRAVALDVLNENIILAGGVTGGIWRSTDGGLSFVKTTDPGQMHSVTSIVQDKRAGHENTWYAGTGEYYGVVSGASFSAQFSGDGIFKSTDNGLTWNSLTSTQSNSPQTFTQNGDMDFIWRIVLDNSNSSQDVILAAVYNGVFISDDGGITWDIVLGVDTTIGSTSDYSDIVVDDAGVFYASLSSDGPDKGIWRSEDGLAWVKIDVGFPANYRRIAMTLNPQNQNELMLIMESPSTGVQDHSLFKYTYVSGDGTGAGGIWENRSANIPNGSCAGFFDFDFGYYYSQGGYDMHITWHPKNQNVVFLGGTNLYRSNDQFTTPTYKWIGGYQCDQANLANYVYPNHHPDQHGLIFLPSDSAKAISCSDGGIHRTENILLDSVMWTSLNNGYVTSQFYTVALEEGEVANDYTTAGAQDNGIWFTKYKHLDSTFKYVYRGDGSYTGIPNGRPFWIFSIQQGKMYKMNMTNDGDTILGTRIDPIGGPTNYNFINPFILDPANPNRLYLAARVRLWRNDSLDVIPIIGDIYNKISTGWTSISQSQIGTGDGYITAVEISKAAPDVVYYGTSNGKLFKLSQSSSLTPLKTTITGSNFPSNSYLSSIAANPFNEDEVMVTFSNYGIRSIFHSTDGGTNWTEISGNLEQFADGTGNGPAVFWATLYPSFNEHTYFVGTSIGLYSTTQLNGNSTVWQQEGASTIGRVIINMMKARTSDGKMVVATHGNGIYTSQLEPTFLSTTEISKNGLSFITYPNPFTEYSVLDLSIPEDGNLLVEVFDINGRKIKTICQQKVQQGQKRLIWYRDDENGNKVSSGTYLIKIRTTNQHMVKKVIVQ